MVREVFMEEVGFELGLEGSGAAGGGVWQGDVWEVGGLWVTLKAFSDSSFHQHEDSVLVITKSYALWNIKISLHYYNGS